MTTEEEIKILKEIGERAKNLQVGKEKLLALQKELREELVKVEKIKKIIEDALEITK